MKRWAYLASAAFLAFGVSVGAQDAKTKILTAIGPVKSVSTGFFTVDANNTTMKFTIDANTNILARGAGAKTRAKKAAGEGGLTIADVVHEGDQVFVRYTEAGGAFLANEVEVRRPRPLAAQPVK
jgi:hypothetical protein